MKEFIDEIIEEAVDFFEDFFEHLVHVKPHKVVKQKQVVVNGVMVTARPAYAFAERIDNLLRLFFGVSIMASAITATFIGFSTLSGLLEVLIYTLGGRIIMGVIGLSYFILATWKLLHIKGTH